MQTILSALWLLFFVPFSKMTSADSSACVSNLIGNVCPVAGDAHCAKHLFAISGHIGATTTDCNAECRLAVMNYMDTTLAAEPCCKLGRHCLHFSAGEQWLRPPVGSKHFKAICKCRAQIRMGGLVDSVPPIGGVQYSCDLSGPLQARLSDLNWGYNHTVQYDKVGGNCGSIAADPCYCNRDGSLSEGCRINTADPDQKDEF